MLTTGKQVGFQTASKLLWSNSWIAQILRQWIPDCGTSRSEGATTEGAAADTWNSQLMVAGWLQVLDSRDTSGRLQQRIKEGKGSISSISSPVQTNQSHTSDSYPFSSLTSMMLCLESYDPKLFNSCRSCSAKRSSDDWCTMSIWFSKNISLFRSDSRIRLKLVCMLALACKTHKNTAGIKTD